MKKVLVLNGINLNMFGKRDPKQYGTTTLAEIDSMLKELAKSWVLRSRVFRRIVKAKWSSGFTRRITTRLMLW